MYIYWNYIRILSAHFSLENDKNINGNSSCVHAYITLFCDNEHRCTKNNRERKKVQNLWRMQIKIIMKIKRNRNSSVNKNRFLFMAEIICVQANSLHLFFQLYLNPYLGFVWFPLFFFHWNFFEDSVCFGIIVFVEYISGRGTEYAQSCCRFIVWEQCEQRTEIWKFHNTAGISSFWIHIQMWFFHELCECVPRCVHCALCNQCSGINKYTLLIAMSNIKGKWQIEKFAHEIFNHNEMKWTEQDKSAFLFGGKKLRCCDLLIIKISMFGLHGGCNWTRSLRLSHK